MMDYIKIIKKIQSFLDSIDNRDNSEKILFSNLLSVPSYHSSASEINFLKFQVKWPIAKIIVYTLPSKSTDWKNLDTKKEKSEILLRYHRTPAVVANR